MPIGKLALTIRTAQHLSRILAGVRRAQQLATALLLVGHLIVIGDLTDQIAHSPQQLSNALHDRRGLIGRVALPVWLGHAGEGTAAPLGFARTGHGRYGLAGAGLIGC